MNSILYSLLKGKKKKAGLLLLILLAVGIYLFVNGRSGEEEIQSATEVQFETGTEVSPETEAPETAVSERETLPESSSETSEKVTGSEEKTKTEGSSETVQKTESSSETTVEHRADTEPATETVTVEREGSYTDRDHVALYIHLYGELPGNYLTKKEAEALGWSSGKSLWAYAEGKSIGGSSFGNYEGLLPKKSGRKYYECDIDYDGKKRNAKRIVYSNDGLVYYTEDHYGSFELLYEPEK